MPKQFLAGDLYDYYSGSGVTRSPALTGFPFIYYADFDLDIFGAEAPAIDISFSDLVAVFWKVQSWSVHVTYTDDDGSSSVDATCVSLASGPEDYLNMGTFNDDDAGVVFYLNPVIDDSGAYGLQSSLSDQLSALYDQPGLSSASAAALAWMSEHTTATASVASYW